MRNILKKTKAALFVRVCVCVCVVCAQYSEKDQSGSFCVCGGVWCAREGVRACVCVCVR